MLSGALDNMIALLEDKISVLGDDAKDCSLFLDEMSIDEAKEVCPTTS